MFSVFICMSYFFFIVFLFLFFFFFQAEDGIRDFCLSRGLGDVYKRQGGIEKVSYGDLEYFIARIVLSCWHTCVNTLAQS